VGRLSDARKPIRVTEHSATSHICSGLRVLFTEPMSFFFRNSLYVQKEETQQMTISQTITSTEGRDLILTRTIDAPSEKVFRAWTEPELLSQWFAPAPWTTSKVETDIRVGGSSLVVMRSPEGVEFPNRGVYLEVIPNERLVITDAYVKAWEPSEKPFMTVILTFEQADGQTRYTARVRHWTEADREAHEKMGFHVGWPLCTEQLVALVTRL
jgi:uncharacterized protein YndB with AHSA1/START domain